MGNFWKKINTVFTKINTKLSKTVISLKDPKKIAKKHKIELKIGSGVEMRIIEICNKMIKGIT